MDADSASAYIVANDSLQVLLQQVKRQSEVMEAASSAAVVAETGALVPCLTDLAGGGMQYEENLDDLDDTQETEPGRKRWKEDNVAKEMLMRCAEEAAGRATSEVKDITSRLMQDAADQDRRLAERDLHTMEQLTGLMKGVSETMEGRMSDLEKRFKVSGWCAK